MFDEPTKLALGLLTGFLFGFLLQKGRVAKFDVIVGQLLLRDWTVVKLMATAVAVGAVGVYALVAAGHASLHLTLPQLTHTPPWLWAGGLLLVVLAAAAWLGRRGPHGQAPPHARPA